MKRILQIITVACCALTITSVTFSASAETPQTSQTSGQQTSGSSASAGPQINAKTAVLLDADATQVLYNKDMNKQMYPASITKIMTGLLAAELGKADDVVTVSSNIYKSQGKSVSCIGLEPGEQLTQDSLMYTMFLASANDSAYALAEHIAGNVDTFVGLMNYEAQKIGANNTHFANPNGLPDTNNYTTAYDMALISQKAVSDSTVLKYFGAVRQVIPADNKLKSCQYGTLVNMLRSDSKYYYPGIIAAKSGWIQMSGFTLVTAAKRNGRTLICVEMGGASWDDVYRGSIDLFNYGFSLPVPVQTSVSSATAVVGNTAQKAAVHKQVSSGAGAKAKSFAAIFIAAAVVCVAAVVLIKKYADNYHRLGRAHYKARSKVYGSDGTDT